MDVEIRRIDPELPLPAYHSAGAAGFDLYCREERVVAPREIALRRLERAEALGMSYREYTLEILERGRHL